MRILEFVSKIGLNLAELIKSPPHTRDFSRELGGLLFKQKENFYI